MYSLRRSIIDSHFLEILFGGAVIQEVKVPFAIRYIPSSFGTLEELNHWLEQTEDKLVKSAAYRFLSRRSYSKAILLQKLKEKKYSLSKCLKVVDELEKLGYLSDADYVEMLIRQKMRQGYGPLHIERALRENGLDASVVRERMDVQMQKEAVTKWFMKMRGKEKSKMIAFLLRRGFDYSVIQCM